MSQALPFNNEAEEHVVGACIYSLRACQVVSEILDPSHLHSNRLALILRECLTAYERGDTVDPVTLANTLSDDLAVQKMRELAGEAIADTNVQHHATIVREHHTRRELIRIGQTIAQSGWDPPADLEDALGDAEQAVYELTTQQEAGELRPISETLTYTFEQLAKPGGEVTGTPSGLADIDSLTAGFQPGNLVIVAARPGMGKSSLALQAAHHAAVKLDRTVAFFTLEMSAEEINQRLLSIEARVALMTIRTRNGLTPPDRLQLDTARVTLDKAPLYVDDTVSARITDIRARARRLKARREDLCLIVVDYLQLMLHDGRPENRNLEVAHISRGLKLLARELDVPVMALAQLNRQPEQRADRKPMLADLRDSGAIEQDADLVLFLHRDPATEEDGTVVDVTLAKHRNGPTGPAKLTWIKRRATFANHTEENH